MAQLAVSVLRSVIRVRAMGGHVDALHKAACTRAYSLPDKDKAVYDNTTLPRVTPSPDAIVPNPDPAVA